MDKKVYIGSCSEDSVGVGTIIIKENSMSEFKDYAERNLFESKVRDLLEEHESAPSAVNLVMAFLLGVNEIPDSFCDLAYNCSEGLNDSFRDSMLNYMSDESLRALHRELLDIAVEKELLDA